MGEEYSIDLSFQKEGGPYRVTLENSFGENGTEISKMSLYEKGFLLKQEYSFADDDVSYGSFIGGVGEQLKTNYPEFFDEEKFLTSDLEYRREVPAKYLLNQVDKYIEDVHGNYEDGSFSKESRDLMLKDAEKYKELLTVAVRNEQTLSLSCDVSNTHQVFDINRKDLMNSLEALQPTQENKNYAPTAYKEFAKEVQGSSGGDKDVEAAKKMLMDGKGKDFVESALAKSPNMKNLDFVDKMLKSRQIVAQAAKDPVIKKLLSRELGR